MDKEDVASGINKQSCKCCLVLQLLACDLKKIPAEIQTHIQPALNSAENCLTERDLLRWREDNQSFLSLR